MDNPPRFIPVFDPDPVSRFWSKIEMRGSVPCWAWTAGTFRSGYGAYKWEGKIRRAHRVAWELCYGPIPDGLHVLHRCNNRACCNPVHLYLGDHFDNMRDRKAAGKYAPEFCGAKASR